MAKKFKPGDMWSSDFDYDGMLDYGRKIDGKTSDKQLDKYADSMEDVNYHTLAKPLFDYQIATSGDKERIKKYYLRQFKRGLSDQLEELGEERLSFDDIYKYKKGGKTDTRNILMRGKKVRIINTRNHNKEGYLVSNKLPNGKFKVILENGKLTSTSSDNIMLIDEKIYFEKGGRVDKELVFDISDRIYFTVIEELGIEDEMIEETYEGTQNTAKGRALFYAIEESVESEMKNNQYGLGGYLMSAGIGAYLGAKNPSSVRKVTDPLDKAVSDIGKNITGKKDFAKGGEIDYQWDRLQLRDELIDLGDEDFVEFEESQNDTVQDYKGLYFTYKDRLENYHGKNYKKGGELKETINLKSYNFSGKVINSGKFIVDYENETITFPSGKTYKVVEDYEYTYKVLKTKIRATGGIKGFVKFLEGINRQGSAFNPSLTNSFINKDVYAQGGTIEERVYAIDKRNFRSENLIDTLDDDKFMEIAENEGLIWSSMDRFLDSNEYNEEGDNLKFREIPVKMMVADEYVNPDFLEKGGLIDNTIHPYLLQQKVGKQLKTIKGLTEDEDRKITDKMLEENNQQVSVNINYGIDKDPNYFAKGGEIEDMDYEELMEVVMEENSSNQNEKLAKEIAKIQEFKYDADDGADFNLVVQDYLDKSTNKNDDEAREVLIQAFENTGTSFAKGGSIRRTNNSPLLRYTNYEDGWRLNLLELNPLRNQDGLKYKGNYKYGISRQGPGTKQEVWQFETLKEADKKYDELVDFSKTYSKIEKKGKIEANYAKGGQAPDDYTGESPVLGYVKVLRDSKSSYYKDMPKKGDILPYTELIKDGGGGSKDWIDYSVTAWYKGRGNEYTVNSKYDDGDVDFEYDNIHPYEKGGMTMYDTPDTKIGEVKFSMAKNQDFDIEVPEGKYRLLRSKPFDIPSQIIDMNRGNNFEKISVNDSPITRKYQKEIQEFYNQDKSRFAKGGRTYTDKEIQDVFDKNDLAISKEYRAKRDSGLSAYDKDNEYDDNIWSLMGNNMELYKFAKKEGIKAQPKYLKPHDYKNIDEIGYAKGGMISVKDTLDEAVRKLTPNQKKIYNRHLERTKKLGDSFTDDSLADYVNGWYGEDIVDRMDFSGVKSFNLGYKVVALNMSQQEDDFWEFDDDYAKGGEIYEVEYWETEEDRDMGEGNMYMLSEEEQVSKEKSIQRAKNLFSKQNFASVEVLDEDGSVVFYISNDEPNGESYAKGGMIPFSSSNLYFNSFGKDSNGNSVIKVSFPNSRAFSIQTNGDLPKTHSLKQQYSKIENLSDEDLKIVEKEVTDYVKEFGSDTQIKKLNTYAKGGEVKIKGNEMIIGGLAGVLLGIFLNK